MAIVAEQYAIEHSRYLPNVCPNFMSLNFKFSNRIAIRHEQYIHSPKSNSGHGIGKGDELIAAASLNNSCRKWC